MNLLCSYGHDPSDLCDEPARYVAAGQSLCEEHLREVLEVWVL